MEHDDLPRRRHRPLLGISGLTLFVCLFLPAMRVCSHDDTPLEYPFVWPPYFYGLAFFVCALLGSRRRGLAPSVAIVRALSFLFVAATLALAGLDRSLGGFELVIALAIVWSLGAGVRESRLALTTVVVGTGCAMWFFVMATQRGALYGLWLSLGSSIGVLLSGVIWHLDIAADPPPVPAVPRAIAREVG